MLAGAVNPARWRKLPAYIPIGCFKKGYVTNKAPEIWEYYPLLVVSFPYLQCVIKGKSERGVDYSLINEYNIRERDGG